MWVLIVLNINSSYYIQMHDFSSLERCKSAGNVILQSSSYNRTTCVPK